ncbi:hypothetical protein GPZ77_33885 [Streptomyces sp. QHH-9511]|uniref:hypothetical protein n=1 Tax=Streptomyces sp. QHH-9511 TaxID=2684468 RepID=UPI0013190321|nr:hypothetical protein [Streptomyces sp. QHH-9511]QGZ52624.1 hypothetical protein GPZ77_33885 [Streptomyces sp. QHH-9511]
MKKIIATAALSLSALAMAGQAHAEPFPPVNQFYTLQEPVQLFMATGEAAGTLDDFAAVVNQSSVPAS